MSEIPTSLPYLTALSLADCYQAGIRGLLLDMDNTLVSEDDKYFTPHLASWLQEAKRLGIKLFLVSNGKRAQRFAFWCSFWGISGICNARKPTHKGIITGKNTLELSENQIILIGDTWPTDILGGKLLGIKTIQVASLPHPPRFWEKILPFVQQQYPVNTTPPEEIPHHIRTLIPEKYTP